jgi:hypothetical protein
MVSRRAQRRMRKYAIPTAANSEVVHAEVVYWPKYFWLMEHTRRHTVIRVPGPQDMLEIERMMRNGNELCAHSDELDECIHIEPATIDEWLETHPGE